MRLSVCVIALVLPMLIFAQNEEDPCRPIESMYEQKIMEVYTLRDSVQWRNTWISSLQKQLFQMKNLLKTCREDSVRLQNKLAKCNVENIKRNEDSIQALNVHIAILKDSLLHTTQKVQQQDIEITKLSALVEYLDNQFGGKTIDELYQMSNRGKLYLCRDIYRELGMELPENIRLTLTYLDAEKLVTKKYDKICIERAIGLLPQDTETGRAIVQHLQDYATLNTEANELWLNIKLEVCSEEIQEDDAFLQIQKKRQIWQRTQKFLNRYPALATDYPYIFEQLQSMLRQIWSNANNFNKIQNPFE